MSARQVEILSIQPEIRNGLVCVYVIVLFAVARDLCTAISSILAAPLHSRSEPLEIGTLVLGHSTRSFARTICSPGCSALLTSLARFAPLRSLAHSLALGLEGQWNVFIQFSKRPAPLCFRCVHVYVCDCAIAYHRHRGAAFWAAALEGTGGDEVL